VRLIIHKWQWEEGFGHLASYVIEHDYARVPGTDITSDGYSLGMWVTTQCANKGRDPERDARLEAVNDWVWDPLGRRR
jgi:hypothetical protein